MKVLGYALLASFGLGLWAGDGPKFEANKSCLECHDGEVDPLHKTIHLPTFGVSCQDCHIESEAHMEDEDQPIFSPKGLDGDKVCMSCHQTTASFFGRSNHQMAEVSCDQCHDSHKNDAVDSPILAQKQTGLCLSCHTDQSTDFRKPFKHQLGHGSMSCSSCHNPHANPISRMLASSHRMNSACSDCHAEKMGPFVFGHVDDCSACHEPHGSSNPMQLNRNKVNQLCLECHSSVSLDALGSQAPSSHDLRSIRYQDCTVCHSAIHGSSQSPALLK